MTLFSASSRWIIPVLLVVLQFGCSLTSDERDETKEAHYLTGKRRQQSMDYKGAAEAFEKALEVNPQSSAAHRELGLLYADKLNESASTEEERGRNFATAIYHLERFVQLNPKSPWVARLRGQIEGCKYELAKTAPFTLLPTNVQAELERLNATNTVLRQQVEQLKLHLAQQAYTFSNRLAMLQTQNATNSNLAAYVPPNIAAMRTNSISVEPSVDPKQRPRSATRQAPIAKKPLTPLEAKPGVKPSQSDPVAISRTHTVRSHETFASIARAHSIPLGSLLSANPGVEARKLKVGQTLSLPGPKS